MRGTRYRDRRVSSRLYGLPQPFTVRLDHGTLSRGHQHLNINFSQKPRALVYLPVYLIHIVAILGILSLHFVPNPLPPLLQFVRDWYALGTILLFYWGVKPLTQMVFQGLFDDRIIRWENRLFNGQPSTYLSERYPSVALSEYLHLCYLSYYFIPFSCR